jgi:hypothetical protein
VVRYKAETELQYYSRRAQALLTSSRIKIEHVHVSSTFMTRINDLGNQAHLITQPCVRECLNSFPTRQSLM